MIKYFICSWLISCILLLIPRTNFLKIEIRKKKIYNRCSYFSCLVTSILFLFVIKQKYLNLQNGDVSQQIYLYVTMLTVVPIFACIMFVILKPFVKNILYNIRNMLDGDNKEKKRNE